MDPDNPVVKLCARGMQAECEGRNDIARRLFEQAWAERSDDYDRLRRLHRRALPRPAPGRLAGHPALEPGGAAPRRRGR
jgi:hypothetical protein